MKKEKISALLTADIHLRDTQPVARLDDYWETQKKKIEYILEFGKANDIPIYVAGDFFDKAKSSQFLESWIIHTIKEKGSPKIIVIPGQHDLPNHSIELVEKSSLNVLAEAGVIDLFKIPWDVDILKVTTEGRTIGLMHTMVYLENPIHDKVEGTKARSMLKKYPDCDLLLTGDNHNQFIYEDKTSGRLIVNPGSMMRMDADQIKHQPAFYLWYSKSNTIEKVLLPAPKNVVTREHIEVKEFRDEKIKSFIRRIKDDYEVGISFQRNIKSFFNRNKEKVRGPVQDLVWRFIKQDE